MKSNFIVPSYDLDKESISDDSLILNRDKFLKNSDFEKTHINMSPFVLCESFGSRVLGLRGYSLSAYRLLGSFAVKNFDRYNNLYCCFSFHWLAISLNCAISTAKRVIKSLCDKDIIKRIGRGHNGRNVYKVLKIYDFDAFGALMSYYEPLNKKSSKRNNLKNKDNDESINKYGLPSWVSYFGNYERFLVNRCYNVDEISQIARIKWVRQ